MNKQLKSEKDSIRKLVSQYELHLEGEVKRLMEKIFSRVDKRITKCL